MTFVIHQVKSSWGLDDGVGNATFKVSLTILKSIESLTFEVLQVNRTISDRPARDTNPRIMHDCPFPSLTINWLAPYVNISLKFRMKPKNLQFLCGLTYF